MRYIAFHVEPPEEPWVVAEGPDESFMRDLPHNVWYLSVVLSEVEAALDPDFAPVLNAWRAGDDSAHEAWETVCAAEGTLDDAKIALIREGELELPDPPGMSMLEAFMSLDENHPDVECDRLFKLIVGSCFNAEMVFGEERAVRLWRRVAHYCKDAAERDHQPRLV